MPIPLMMGIALPGNADLESLNERESLPPLFNQVCIGEKIRHTRWNRLQRCLEKPRQADQRRLHVKLRQWISFRNQLVNSLARGKERDQESGTLDNDGSTPLLNQWGIADELEHVA